jgi:hypothetical protein
MHDTNGNSTGGAHTSPPAHCPDIGSPTWQSRAVAVHPAAGTFVAADATHVPSRGLEALTCMWVPPHPGPTSTHVPDDTPTVAHCEPALHIAPW